MRPEKVLAFLQCGLFGFDAGLAERSKMLAFEKMVTLLAGFYDSVVKWTGRSVPTPVRAKRTHGPGLHALKGSHNIIQGYVLRRFG